MVGDGGLALAERLFEMAAAYRSGSGRSRTAPAAVGVYIGATYFFTSSLTEAPSPAR